MPFTVILTPFRLTCNICRMERQTAMLIEGETGIVRVCICEECINGIKNQFPKLRTEGS